MPRRVSMASISWSMRAWPVFAATYSSPAPVPVIDFLRFGLHLRLVTPPRSSPTMRMGLSPLKARWVHFALATTFCQHKGPFLFTERSYTCVTPSDVMAAKTVLLYGAQATSPTCCARSKDMMAVLQVWSHIFTVQSAEDEIKMFAWKWFHLTAYTAIPCPSYVSRYCPLYDLEHLWIRPSSVPMRKRSSFVLWKSKQRPPASPVSPVSSSSPALKCQCKKCRRKSLGRESTTTS
mmetsp:Transcript_17393/g.43292  ORF Transcript_17393/g.43292 Transcript_17393/m.43292 type:complete len:235 (+) Transcript_17393:876-1580(+)